MVCKCLLGFLLVRLKHSMSFLPILPSIDPAYYLNMIYYVVFLVSFEIDL